MTFKKIAIAAAILLVLGGLTWLTIWRSQANVIKVTTATIGKQDLTSVVSGTGQIKPKTYVNIGATAFGRITHLNVKEGDHVKKGAVLATVESVQPAATVAAQEATIASSKTDVTSYVAAEKTAVANIDAGQGRPRAEEARLRPRPGSLQGSSSSPSRTSTPRRPPTTCLPQPSHQRVAAVAQAKAQTDSMQRGHMDQAGRLAALKLRRAR